jgi:hypothetical protein
MQNENLIETKEALEIIERLFRPTSLPTLIKWCSKYNLGLKIGGRWFVDKIRLIEFLTRGNQKWSKGDDVGRPKKNQSRHNFRNLPNE